MWYTALARQYDATCDKFYAATGAEAGTAMPILAPNEVGPKLSRLQRGWVELLVTVSIGRGRAKVGLYVVSGCQVGFGAAEFWPRYAKEGST